MDHAAALQILHLEADRLAAFVSANAQSAQLTERTRKRRESILASIAFLEARPEVETRTPKLEHAAA